MKRMLFILVTVLLIASCKSQQKTGKEDSREAADMPTLSMIASDLYGGAEEEVFEVIRDQAALQKFYRKVNMTRKPGLAVPQIDFSKNLAVLYCSGSTKATALPEMYISGENETEMYLEKSRLDAKEGIVTSTATVTPFGLYLLPLTDQQVIFRQK